VFKRCVIQIRTVAFTTTHELHATRLDARARKNPTVSLEQFFSALLHTRTRHGVLHERSNDTHDSRFSRFPLRTFSECVHRSPLVIVSCISSGSYRARLQSLSLPVARTDDRTLSRTTQVKTTRHSITPRAVHEVAQVAAGGGMTAFFALAGVAAAATAGATKRIEARMEEAMDVAKSKGIDLSDLYYDFDLPGDAYPFGDAEGMDWVPKDWKPPKKGDMKYLPSRMLGMVQVRISLYDLLQECEQKNIDVSDVCVPFEGYEGPFDTNQKRMMELRKRLGK